jgi:succinoglycan biosynthesis transport protein ExoP
MTPRELIRNDSRGDAEKSGAIPMTDRQRGTKPTEPWESRVPALAERQPVAARQMPLALQPAASDEEIDDLRANLLRYLGVILKHRWLVAGVTVIVFALGFFYTFLTTPIYSAAATIQIDREVEKIAHFEDGQSIPAYDPTFLHTQYELLKSRSLATRVVARLSLTEDVAFLRSGAPSPWSKLRQMIVSANIAKAADPEVALGDFDRRQSLAVAKVLQGLSVQPVGGSRLVRIAYASPDPQAAQRIANATAESFIQANLDRRYEASSYARDFLQERLQELKLKLEESEEQLVKYAQDQQIVHVDDRESLVRSNLAGVRNALEEASRNRLRAEQMWQQARNADGLGLAQIMDRQSIEALRRRQADLIADYEEKLNVFKPAYPEMMKLKSQVDEIDHQIQVEVALLKQSIKAQYEAAAAQEASLTAELESLKQQLLDFEERNIQYRIMAREVDTNRTLYEGLLQRYKEIGVAGGVGTNNISIVDRAQTPGAPFKPDLSTNLFMALGLGLFLGGFAAIGLEFFDDSLKLAEEVEAALSLPVLGVIPLGQTAEPIREAAERPRSSLAEAFRSLRTALQFSTETGAPGSVVVTSSRPGEGKSTVALALARNFAEMGLKVLLVDADLRDPSLHRELDLGNEAGLTNYLAGTAAPPELFQATAMESLTFLPTGPLPPNPAELLAGPKMPSLLHIAEERFDIVVVDAPPVMGLADAPLLASVAGATLLVLSASETRKGAARETLKRLTLARARVIGAVLNKFDHRKTGFTYGYGYGYGYGDPWPHGADRHPAELDAGRA